MNKLNLPPFYIGQKVVCIEGSFTGGLNKGHIYTITDIKKCKCGCTQVSWGYKTEFTYLDCYGCGKDLSIGSLSEFYCKSTRFKPLEEMNAQLLTFKQIKEVEKEEVLILN